jgi:hypothetical protein
MSRVLRVLAGAAGLGALLVLVVPFAGAATVAPRTAATAPWLLHIERYPGGISAGVRAMVAADQAKAALGLAVPSFMAGGVTGGRDNLQMNTDSNPPMPQDETAVALDATNPMVAVAAANDYINGGLIVMSTADGGLHWTTGFVVPEVHWQGLNCGGGGDPAVAYSLRDSAFYLGQLCFSGDGTSEVHVFKSVDGGLTWTPGSQSAVVVSNFDPSSGIDTSLFYDHDFLTVDNSPASPHYGRIYSTYVKFHTDPSGFSDYCPAQIAYTDQISTSDPSTAVWSHTGVVADNPGGPGIGPTANQDVIARTQADGSVDVTYTFEDCNTGLDRHLAFKKSVDGGASFPAHPTRIDKPGQFKDNPNLDDTLPPTAFRAPLGPDLAISPTTGTLAYVYQNNIERARSGADISLSLSHDGGATWSDATFLSTWSGGNPAGNDQFFPAIAATESGTFYAIWFDRRRDPANTNIDTWEAVSTDDGATWTQRRISSTSWDPNRGFFNCGCFIGDYNQIAASDAVVYPVWTDGRDSAIDRTGIGETDIFTDVEIH